MKILVPSLLVVIASVTTVAEAANAPAELPSGFLCCNMHVEDKWISDINYQDTKQQLVPLGTPMTVVDLGRNRVKVKSPVGDLTIGNDYSRTLELAAFASRYIMREDPRLKLSVFSPEDRMSIEHGHIRIGMTREQVVMAIGYPVTSENFGYYSKLWRYPLSKNGEFRVRWDDEGHVSALVADEKMRALVLDGSMEVALENPDDTPSGQVEREQWQYNPEHAATVRNAVLGTRGKGSVSVSRFVSGACNPLWPMRGRREQTLFASWDPPAELPRTATVPVDEPVRLIYEELDGSSRCTAIIEVPLLARGKYTAIGDTAYVQGLLPFLPSKGCRFGVVDDASGKLVPATKLNLLSVCTGIPQGQSDEIKSSPSK